MQKTFITEDFLLKNTTAQKLYKEYAAMKPIVDYHCHLKAEDILENTAYKNITTLWLGGDHYKWRLMRANGIDENLITGDASDKEKFMAWIDTIQYAIGNPLYHWSHMELQSFFNIDVALTSANAEFIWNTCNDQLGEDGLRARDFIKKSNVVLIGTTDDPCSQLLAHQEVKKLDLPFKVTPTYRMDKLLTIHAPVFLDYIKEMEENQQHSIIDYDDYLTVIKKQIEFFINVGMKSADLGLPQLIGEPFNRTECKKYFSQILGGNELEKEKIEKLQTMILVDIAKVLADSNQVLQIHFGARGSVNERARVDLGTSTGFDTISDETAVAERLITLFNAMNNNDGLPKCIVYNIDGTKNDVIMSVISAFQDETGQKSKMQLGSAWWFQDTKEGMEKQLTSVATQGMLNNFIGMLTDSRSFLSYQRHDYFRRILCNMIGTLVENKEATADEKILGELIENISYKNAQQYFGLNGGK